MIQAFRLLLDIFGPASLVAMLVALASTTLMRLAIPVAWKGYFVLPLSVAAAYVVGYAALPRDWAAFTPQQHSAWQWLPYLGLAAAIFAASFPPSPRWTAWKFTVIAIAPIAAAALAPSWPMFGFGQQQLRIFVAIYLVIIGFPLQYLPSRCVGHIFAALLCLSAFAVALATGIMVSTRLAQLAAIAAAALAGGWIGLLAARRPFESTLQSAVPVFTVLVGGAAWSACAEPDPPLTWLLALPLLPLVIWLAAIYRIVQLPFAARQNG